MPDALDRQVEELRRLMAERLEVRGASLSEQVRHAGRLLPRGVRRDLRVVLQSQQMMHHPRLYLTVDQAKARDAGQRVADHLRGIDPAKRRTTRWLGMAGVISFNLILVFAGLVVVLVWRGYL